MVSLPLERVRLNYLYFYFMGVWLNLVFFFTLRASRACLTRQEIFLGAMLIHTWMYIEVDITYQCNTVVSDGFYQCAHEIEVSITVPSVSTFCAGKAPPDKLQTFHRWTRVYIPLVVCKNGQQLSNFFVGGVAVLLLSCDNADTNGAADRLIKQRMRTTS